MVTPNRVWLLALILLPVWIFLAWIWPLTEIWAPKLAVAIPAIQEGYWAAWLYWNWFWLVLFWSGGVIGSRNMLNTAKAANEEGSGLTEEMGVLREGKAREWQVLAGTWLVVAVLFLGLGPGVGFMHLLLTLKMTFLPQELRALLAGLIMGLVFWYGLRPIILVIYREFDV